MQNIKPFDFLLLEYSRHIKKEDNILTTIEKKILKSSSLNMTLILSFMQAYQQLLRPMKGSKTGLPHILPPKARRMRGRPKKHRRKEQGEVGKT